MPAYYNLWNTLWLLYLTLKLLFQGSVAITGAAVKWLRDNLNVIGSASEIGKIIILHSKINFGSRKNIGS